MSTLTQTTNRTGFLRAGIVLALFLSVLDIAGGVIGFAEQDVFSSSVSIYMLVLAFGTIVASVFAWRGSTGAAISVAVMRVLASLAGLPAFFFADIPAFLVVIAAFGILAAILCAGLVLYGMGRR